MDEFLTHECVYRWNNCMNPVWPQQLPDVAKAEADGDLERLNRAANLKSLLTWSR